MCQFVRRPSTYRNRSPLLSVERWEGRSLGEQTHCTSSSCSSICSVFLSATWLLLSSHSLVTHPSSSRCCSLLIPGPKRWDDNCSQHGGFLSSLTCLHVTDIYFNTAGGLTFCKPRELNQIVRSSLAFIKTPENISMCYIAPQKTSEQLRRAAHTSSLCGSADLPAPPEPRLSKETGH